MIEPTPITDSEQKFWEGYSDERHKAWKLCRELERLWNTEKRKLKETLEGTR